MNISFLEEEKKLLPPIMMQVERRKRKANPIIKEMPKGVEVHSFKRAKSNLNEHSAAKPLSENFLYVTKNVLDFSSIKGEETQG